MRFSHVGWVLVVSHEEIVLKVDLDVRIFDIYRSEHQIPCLFIDGLLLLIRQLGCCRIGEFGGHDVFLYYREV